ncbi:MULTISPECIES: hypothetical protein [unclassified Marinomonas]|uniref:hypothetical protein n=1 Tax=unclassified Marinomonas TaxID=196814 RepID=UPI0007AEFB99|nr:MULTISPECIES: hypothetical protein [unclassified Marinomonas]
MNQVINWVNYCFRSILLCITYFFSWLKGFYKRHYNLSTIGILGTFGYFSFLYQTLGFETITWMKGAKNFNEVGDFLAGVFGPVAFFWLIIGYQMQHSELRLNRKSLEKQADELEYSRKALELQVNEFKQNVELTKDNFNFQKEIHNKKEATLERSKKPYFDKVEAKLNGNSIIIISIRNIGGDIRNIETIDKEKNMPTNETIDSCNKFQTITLLTNIKINIDEYKNKAKNIGDLNKDDRTTLFPDYEVHYLDKDLIKWKVNISISIYLDVSGVYFVAYFSMLNGELNVKRVNA